MAPQPSDWRYIAEQIRNEKDPNKMMALVMELNRLLEREQSSKRTH